MEKKVIYNSLWMMLEKVVSIFGLIFVTSFVAKYVGPGIFGSIAYATSIFQIIQVLAQLGSDVIIFKRVSKKEYSGIKLINTTIMMRCLVYFISSLPILFYFYTKHDLGIFYFIFSVFLSCFFYSMDVFSIYYDAKLESKRNTLVNTLALAFCLAVRWFIAFLKLDPLFLCIPIVLTSLVPLIVRVYLYRNNFSFKTKSKRHTKKYIFYVLSCGASLVFSSLSVAIYPRLGMLLLGGMQGIHAVGIYSVAATLAGSWAFICNSFITSSLPALFQAKSDEITVLKASQISIPVILFSICVILSFYFIGCWFINLLYGPDFKDSYTPLIILSASTLISMLGTISARIIAKYSGYFYLSKKMLCVTILSFILNYFMIRYYGVIGAAVATLLTEVISLTFLNYFFREGIILKLHFSIIFLRFFCKNKS